MRSSSATAARSPSRRTLPISSSACATSTASTAPPRPSASRPRSPSRSRSRSSRRYGCRRGEARAVDRSGLFARPVAFLTETADLALHRAGIQVDPKEVILHPHGGPANDQVILVHAYVHSIDHDPVGNPSHPVRTVRAQLPPVRQDDEASL